MNCAHPVYSSWKARQTAGCSDTSRHKDAHACIIDKCPRMSMHHGLLTIRHKTGILPALFSHTRYRRGGGGGDCSRQPRTVPSRRHHLRCVSAPPEVLHMPSTWMSPGHTDTHGHTQTHVSTRTHTDAQTHMDTRTHTWSCGHTWTHKHTSTQAQ